MMLTTVLLDWSGTLADDLAPVIEASNGVLADFGAEQLSREEFRKRFRLPFDGFWRELLPGVSLEELEKSYHRHFIPIQERVALIPGAKEFLEECVEWGIRTVLLSSIHPMHFEKQSADLGVRHLFAELCVGIMDKRTFLGGWLERRKINPSEALFIGDMVHDIDAGRAAGVMTAGVLSGFDPAEKLLAAKPDVVLESIASAGRVFRSAFKLARMPTATVGALIKNVEGKVLMIQTHKWSDRWGIPGGKIEPGEAAHDAIQREVREETGLEIRDIEFAMVQDCIKSVEFHRPAHFLLLNYTATTESSIVSLNEEAEAWVWVAPDQALRMNLNQPTRKLLDYVLQ
jgi:phosphoglycolate phosphatase-like HAD superfamily hydrolase/ADP-ribose pyrophosphatase YjhB (NUDIX family)